MTVGSRPGTWSCAGRDASSPDAAGVAGLYPTVPGSCLPLRLMRNLLLAVTGDGIGPAPGAAGATGPATWPDMTCTSARSLLSGVAESGKQRSDLLLDVGDLVSVENLLPPAR